MKKHGTVLLGVHPDLLQTRADLLDDRFGGVSLDNSAIAAQQVEEKPKRDCGAVRNTPSLDPGNASTCELPMEFGDEPGLADARLADDADRLAAAAFDLLQEIMQDGALALAVDESRRVTRD